MIKTILLDDHKLFCDGLEALLKESKKFDVIGKYSNGKELLLDLGNLSPDLLICDVDMPHMRGFDVIQRVRLTNQRIKIVTLSMHDANVYPKEALQLGASAYINKSIESLLLIESLLKICSNKIKPTAIIPKNPDIEQSVLTPKEMEILKKMSLGKTSEEIAKDMAVSALTIRSHRKNMFKKLKVNNAAELISKSMQLGLL